MKGVEREVKLQGGSTVDGAPVSYIIVLASIVTTLSFIPISIQLGMSAAFPMSQAVFPLIGWILGPIAGAVASMIGTAAGVCLAPHTAGVPWLSVYGAGFGSFVAGSMSQKGTRRFWWIGIAILSVINIYFHTGRAILQMHVPPWIALTGSIYGLSSLALFVLPSRILISRLIKQEKIGLMMVGLFVGTWTAGGLMIVSTGCIAYALYNWPTQVWIMLIPMVPYEGLMRALVGAMIGSGVISGLRAAGLIRPRQGSY
jgi:hypothetical protein